MGVYDKTWQTITRLLYRAYQDISLLFLHYSTVLALKALYEVLLPLSICLADHLSSSWFHLLCCVCKCSGIPTVFLVRAYLGVFYLHRAAIALSLRSARSFAMEEPAPSVDEKAACLVFGRASRLSLLLCPLLVCLYFFFISIYSFSPSTHNEQEEVESPSDPQQQLRSSNVNLLLSSGVRVGAVQSSTAELPSSSLPSSAPYYLFFFLDTPSVLAPSTARNYDFPGTDAGAVPQMQHLPEEAQFQRHIASSDPCQLQGTPEPLLQAPGPQPPGTRGCAAVGGLRPVV